MSNSRMFIELRNLVVQPSLELGLELGFGLELSLGLELGLE